MTTAKQLKTSSRKRLTAKQEAFCVFYFQDRNATQAAIKAGYSPHLIDTNVSHLLDNTRIRERIAECEAKVESAAIGTVSERKKRLTAMYRADFDMKDLTPAHVLTAIAEQNKMERIGAQDNQLPANINIVFAVGRGYQEAVIGSSITTQPG